MKSFFSKVLGENPWTTLFGFLILALTVIQQYMSAGETDWVKIAIGVLAALLGRKAVDAKKS